MARVTHVKKAQQRYATVPVLDADGNPIKTPVMNQRTGQQKVSKRGPVFMTKTVADKTKPLPLLRCDFPGCTINDGKIAIGTSYQHITPKSGPYGGTQKNRHAEHRSWYVWEYSSSTSARAAQVQHDAGEVISSYEFSSYDDFDDLKQQVADMAQELLDEKQESLDAMPEGLADGSQLQEQVEALEAWVEGIEDADEPDRPDTVEVERFFVVNVEDGSEVFEDEVDGFETEEEAQKALKTYLWQHSKESADDFEIEGRDTEIDADSLDIEHVDEDWIEEAKQAIQDALDNCEV